MNDNIVFLIATLKNSGGTQRILSCLCNLLIDEFNITIMVNDNETPFFNLDSRVKIIILPIGKGNIIKRNFVIYKVLKHHKSRYYINLDSNSIMLNSLLIPNFTKIILWEHFSISNNFKKLIFTISRHYAVLRCKEIILLSNFEIIEWGKYNSISKEKSKVVYNPLSLIVEDEDRKNKMHLKVFLAIGNHITVKGFDILLNAWSKIDTDWKLRIVGLDEKQTIKLKLLIEDNNINNIELYGKVRNVNDFYKNASVFLLPSRKEATPLVIVESQAHGLPAIVFDHLPGVLELLDDSALVVDFEEKDISFSNAMKSITNDKVLYNRLHLNALENTKKFSLEKFKENWIKVLS